MTAIEAYKKMEALAIAALGAGAFKKFEDAMEFNRAMAVLEMAAVLFDDTEKEKPNGEQIRSNKHAIAEGHPQ
jgi:hypothetical protein